MPSRSDVFVFSRRSVIWLGLVLGFITIGYLLQLADRSWGPLRLTTSLPMVFYGGATVLGASWIIGAANASWEDHAITMGGKAPAWGAGMGLIVILCIIIPAGGYIISGLFMLFGVSPYQDHALIDTCESGDVIRAATLLGLGASANAQAESLTAFSEGGTALHVASKHGHSEIVLLLLDHAAKVDAQCGDSITPLHIAAREGHTKVAEVLLARGATVDAQDRYKRTPLHTAASEGHAGVAEVLLSRGADVNARDEDKRTPLHGAADRGYPEVIEVLCSYGAEVNAHDDKEGNTPLHLAIRYGKMHGSQGRQKTVLLLRQYGADINIRNASGETALTLANREGDRELISLLLPQ